MAAASATKVGIKAVVYRNAGSYGTPTWTAMPMVRDVQAGTSWEFGDAAIRATRVKLYHPTQQDYDIQMVVRDDDADTGVQLLKDAAVTTTAIDLLIMDAAISVEGAQGVRAHFHVSQTQDQSIGAVIFNTFTLKPGFSTDGFPMSAVAGASSVMTFTAPG